MKYLVARGLGQVLQRVPSSAPKPLQVFEKLPELAGNTNVMDITEGAGTGGRMAGAEEGRDDEKNRLSAGSD